MEQKIAEFLKQAHPSSSWSEEDILRSEDLFADGILDSLLNLKLLLFVEKESGRRIPTLMVSRNNFRSVGALVALLNSYSYGG